MKEGGKSVLFTRSWERGREEGKEAPLAL